MPRGVHLSDKAKERIYNSYTLGESPEDIAESMALNVGTVRRIIREQRKQYEKAREEMGRSGKIVKKDGNGGKLMSLSPEGFEFIHVTPDGKSHKKKVPGHISRVAEQQYDKWCADLDDECEFMRRVERKVDAVEKEAEGPFVPTDEPVQVFEDDEPDGTNANFGEAVCGYPGDPVEDIRSIEPAPVPEIPVRPWREVAEERQQRIEELEARLAEYEDEERKVHVIQDGVVADTELAEPKLDHWFNSNGAFRVIWTDKPVYVLWAKSENPRLYGVYRTMEAALKELDRLNEVAAFLGSEGVFEVEEVAWKA